MNKNIEKRQHYYWIARERKEQGNYLGAIEFYKLYATFLSDKDKHIPFLWISKLYSSFGETYKSLDCQIIYARGCNLQNASELLKNIGYKYIELGGKSEAIMCFREALELNSNIGVSKVLERLESGKI